jgi:hypothetical protein
MLAHPENYRPISLLNCFFKLLESVLLARLRAWFDKSQALHPSQGGFRPQRSTIQQALTFLLTQQWAAKNNFELCAVLLDISKAFDSMSHSGACAKLLSKGVPARFVKLLHSLLSDHTNVLVLNTNLSVNIGRGAMQGSILAPLVFITDIDDVPRVAHAHLATKHPTSSSLLLRGPSKGPSLLYADDTTLFSLPLEMDSLLKASSQCALSYNYGFNPKKSQAIRIGALGRRITPNPPTLDGVPLGWKSSVSLLGVPMLSGPGKKCPSPSPDKLDHWRNQLQALKSFISPRLKLARSLSLRFIKTILVPQWCYGIEIYPPSKEMQILQNDALRIVLNAYDRTHVRDLHRFCGLWRLDSYGMYRRLVSYARWLSLPSHFPITHALTVARDQELPWHLDTMSYIDKLSLRDSWASLEPTILGPNIESNHKKKALSSWKLLVRTAIKTMEAAENKNPSFPHPTLVSPHAGIVFLFAVKSFNPPDVKVIPNCYLCRSVLGDCPEHLLKCNNPKVKAWRNANSQHLVMLSSNVWEWQSVDSNSPLYVDSNLGVTLSNSLHALYALRKESRDKKLRRK